MQSKSFLAHPEFIATRLISSPRTQILPRAPESLAALTQHGVVGQVQVDAAHVGRIRAPHQPQHACLLKGPEDSVAKHE